MISTDINWPAGLPNPQRSGHEMRPIPTFVRSELASGRARQRRQFTSVPTQGTFTWVMTSAQAMAFEAWFRDVIHDGADWFNIKRLTPEGMLVLVCRFADMYQGPAMMGRDRWRYLALLETWERPIAILPPGWGGFTEFFTAGDCCRPGLSIIDLAMNREWPEA